MFISKIKDESYKDSSLVRVTGLEPAQEFPLEPKSNASANSATPAYYFYAETLLLIILYFINSVKLNHKKSILNFTN